MTKHSEMYSKDNELINLPWKLVIHDSGDSIYYLDGVVDSLYGVAPAIQSKIGNKYCFIWFKQGKLHRDNGPAYMFDNIREYWLDGKQYSYEDWDLITSHSDHYP